MNRQQIEARVREIIANYRVNQRNVAGTARRGYAVYAGLNMGRMRPNPHVKQVSEVLTSREANDLKTDLIVADLIELIESLKESKHVHEE